MEIRHAGSMPTRKGPAEWFTGNVWLDQIADAPEPARIKGARVTFEPGARTNWHTHPLGQTLYVLAGVGRFQTEGEQVIELRAGDSVWIPPGEKHWHGGAPETSMTHIALQEALDGSVAGWLEPVSEEDYNAAPAGG